MKKSGFGILFIFRNMKKLVFVLFVIQLISPFCTAKPAEQSTDAVPTEKEDEWQKVTTNIKRYTGFFVQSMNGDLWMSVAIVFVSTFCLCMLIYVILRAVRLSMCIR
ncbi:hypothetical protein JTE90_001362 [Oedothorax gibbosus]|uniref:Uncharacterized protein n=1 Tax=Oedothorax gibbosus TaxID=931172 RepID=A0AAV6VF39_9ARAC|nr:hypothetical protein JTE90_001362 [Oedothorax gibbosus]